ncbi:hypothetical protein DR864_09015 [Runella rosea]|uniref:DUF11 domain-containing protein n=1 Tax=Runella rosea TaxID=2259595 RepID=A0A344TGU2_9BACT|nr:DUF11 domain-containing protein [Runella rosea]AXE17863.1 hypothetical protein DR864_09015 [Runella rosea]
MKKGISTIAWIGLIWFLGFVTVAAQQLSTNQVNYQLTYQANTGLYTVWVVPKYATPNANNTDVKEFGATAQVSLKVPKDFVIQNITDIKGTWEKNPLKLGSQAIFASASLDAAYNYYVIGKTATETDYGSFTNGTPVALFTFQGNACYSPVGILAKADPFVAAAKSVTSLNTACSFYSRSGQTPSGNVIPLEQFVEKLGPDATCNPPIDLSLTVAVSNQQPGLNANLTLTVSVKNEGQNPASGVEVKDILPAGMNFQTFATATGTYNSATGTWTIGNIAVGQTVTLSIAVQVTQTGVQYFTAQISKADQTDTDSTPNNNIESEDDFDRTCITVPVPICVGQVFELSIPSGYTNIQWFRNDQPISGATTSVIQITEAGSYRFTATNTTCPTAGCCSYIFYEGDCCPTKAICVPFTVKKIKK